MAVTVVANAPWQYIGLFGDARPANANIGSLYFAYDTGVIYICRDGNNWEPYSGGGGTGIGPVWGSITPVHTAPTAGVATGAVIGANANRRYLLIINDSANVIYLNLGAAGVLNTGIRLNANGGSLELSLAGGNNYLGAINSITTQAGQVLLVTEG
jgi:hypothetical protein